MIFPESLYGTKDEDFVLESENNFVEEPQVKEPKAQVERVWIPVQLGVIVNVVLLGLPLCLAFQYRHGWLRTHFLSIRDPARSQTNS